MIRNIEKLKDFGIFKNFENNNSYSEFTKNNLFYGWNGSGKTTITRLFTICEEKKISEDFSSSEFILETDVNNIDQKNYVDSNLNVRVFNEDFIKKNINWDGTANSILIISEEKITEKERLNKLSARVKENEDNLLKHQNTSDLLNKEIELFLSSTARNTKEKLEVIDTNDAYYLNYDKRKLKSFIDENQQIIMKGKGKLTEEQVINLTKSVKQDIYPTLDQSNYDFTDFDLNEIVNKISNLLSRNIISNSIERLKENPDIAKWVEEGIEIHNRYKSTSCEYCGQSIPENRILKLNSHISNEFKILKENINEVLEEIEKYLIDKDDFPEQDELYPEFQKEYVNLLEQVMTSSSKLNSNIQRWQSLLGRKYSNPFETINEKIDYIKNEVSEYKLNLIGLNEIIANHNNRTNSFKEETNKLKKQLELHYTIVATQEFQYFDKTRKFTEEFTAKNNVINYLTSLKNKAKELERSLSNEHLGASNFNIQLKRFLGYSAIELQFDPNLKGYRILRNNNIAKNLSEGEKRAISFVYFIMKLKENDNKISDTIIVIDDPVSSFDSNNLYSAYSFLKSECDQAKQTFMFTHNFNYFRLIRDWWKKKNKKEKPSVSNFYTIETIMDNGREAKIKNAHSSLVKYDSEYHYIFAKLFGWRNNESLDLEEALLVANISRKLLEAFLSFKFPNSRNDFLRLMEDSIEDKAKREKIYHFINKYSHHKTIDINDFTIDNVFGESQNVVQDILSEIERLDKRHYDEMIMSLNN